MKKNLLLLLVSFASYAGAFASNEIVTNANSNAKKSKDIIESVNADIVKVAEDKIDFTYNCHTIMRIKDNEGLQTEVNLDTNADNAEDCIAKGLKFATLYEVAGFKITHYSNSYNLNP